MIPSNPFPPLPLLSPLSVVNMPSLYPPQLCSIIVFGCVADQVAGAVLVVGGGTACGYNLSGACSFAIAIGVIGFLLCLVFLVKDVIYVIVDYSENIVVRVLSLRYKL